MRKGKQNDYAVVEYDGFWVRNVNGCYCYFMENEKVSYTVAVTMTDRGFIVTSIHDKTSSRVFHTLSEAMVQVASLCKEKTFNPRIAEDLGKILESEAKDMFGVSV